jgi:hypothetical protein
MGYAYDEYLVLAQKLGTTIEGPEKATRGG